MSRFLSLYVLFPKRNIIYWIFTFRGCEGNDEESDITSDDDESDDSWDESLSQPTSGHEHSTSEDSDVSDFTNFRISIFEFRFHEKNASF